MSKYSQDVIKVLYEHQSNYISGQYIADQLNISRASIGEVIDLLGGDGCDIKSINRKGHQLNSLPDQWYSGIIKPIPDGLGPFNHLEVYHTVDPAQLRAKRALAGSKNTFLVLSNEQTEGRGGFNRNWELSKRKGL